MAAFRKKPVVIQAFRWTGGPDQLDDPVWIVEAIRDGKVRFCGTGEAVAMLLETHQGTATARAGDWIIQQIDGELYPCKHELFDATYEQVL